MRRKHFLLGIGLLGIVSLSGCADDHMEQIEEQRVESESDIDTSEPSDETVNMEIQWESNFLDVDGNGIADYAVVGIIKEADVYNNILEITLDDGRTAALEFQGRTGWREDGIIVRADKLRYADKDSIVIQITVLTSNYGSSDIHILSVDADADEVEIIEEATILDDGINSEAYSLYEDTLTMGETTIISMASEKELVRYVGELGVNAVTIPYYNCEYTQYLYWNGEKWAVSDEKIETTENRVSIEIEEHYITQIENDFNVYYIDKQNVLWGCGKNQYGQLGQGMQDEEFHEEAVKIAEGVIHVDYSQQGFAIYLTDDNKLYGVGNAGGGALQEFDSFSREQYVNGREYAVTIPKLLMENVVYAKCGRDDIVALCSDGSAWTWGTAWYLDMNNFYYEKEPVQLLENVVLVTGGYYNHAALCGDGSVWTWGYNEKGNCGITGDIVVSAPVKVAEDVSLVWTDRIDYNAAYSDIDFPMKGTGIENTIIEKMDGSKWICGAYVGTEEQDLPVYYGAAYKYSVIFANEFMPYNVYHPVEYDADIPQEVVEAKIKVYPVSYIDTREEPGIPPAESGVTEYCCVIINGITPYSFDFEIVECNRQTGENSIIIPNGTAYFVEDGKSAVYYGGKMVLRFAFTDDQFEPILGEMTITGSEKFEGNIYVNNSIPGHEAG